MGKRFPAGLSYFALIFFVVVGASFALGSTYSSQEDFFDYVSFFYEDLTSGNCALNGMPIFGSAFGSVSIDGTGTIELMPSPKIYDNPAIIYSDSTPGPCFEDGEVCYAANISNQGEYRKNKTRVEYGAATSFQNAYAVAVVSRNDITNKTADNGYNGFHRNPSDSVKVDIFAATIGSGINGEFSAYGEGQFANETIGSGIPGYKKGYGWGTGSTSTVNTKGSNTFAMTAAVTSGGEATQNTSYSGIGTTNLVQNPLYPIALLYCDGTFQRQVASECGTTAEYLSAPPNLYVQLGPVAQVAGSESTASISYDIGWGELTCDKIRQSRSASSGFNDKLAASAIESREVVCKDLPQELKDKLGLTLDNPCPDQSLSAPTKANIDSKNQAIKDYFKAADPTLNHSCEVKTYVATQATPDTHPWAANDSGPFAGHQFDDIKTWASKVYATYMPSQTCNKTYNKDTIDDSGINYACELSAAPNPEEVNKNVTWTAQLFTVDESGNTRPTTKQAAYDWDGSDGARQENGTNTLVHAYKDPGKHFMHAFAKISSLGTRTITVPCEEKNTVITATLKVTCSGTPPTQLNGNPGEVTWMVSPSGGTAKSLDDYKIEWNWPQKPSNEATIDKTAQTVKAEYNTDGKKTANVKVTDSANNTQTANCEVEINPFEVSCSGTPATAYLNEPVTWNTTVLPDTGTQKYSWTGTDLLTGNTKTVNKTNGYSSAGNKYAQVDVTINGTTKTAECGPITVLPITETNTPSCLVEAEPTTFNAADNPKTTNVTVTALKLPTPVTNITANCGDGATTTNKDNCQGTGIYDKQQCNFTCENYTTSGKINVTLSDGTIDTQCSTDITVKTDTTNHNPTCDLTSDAKSTDNKQVNQPVTFTISNAKDPVNNQPITSGTINFKDGQSSQWTGGPVTHTYTTTGTYTPELEITGQGGKGKCTTNVTINTGGGSGGTYNCKFTSPLRSTYREGDLVPFAAEVRNNGAIVTDLSIFNGRTLKYDIITPPRDPATRTNWNLTEQDGAHKYYLPAGETSNRIDYTARLTLNQTGKSDVSCDKTIKILAGENTPTCIATPLSANIIKTGNANFELTYDALLENVDSINLKCTNTTTANVSTVASGCIGKKSTMDDHSCIITCGNYSGAPAKHNVTADLKGANGNTLKTCTATVTTTDPVWLNSCTPETNLVSLKIEPPPSPIPEFSKSEPNIILKVIVTKFDPGVNSATFKLKRYKARIDEKSVEIFSQPVSFTEGGPVPETIEIPISDRTSNLSTGPYVYTAQITDIKKNNTSVTDLCRSDNISQTGVLLTQTQIAVPELPIVFVVIILLAIIAIMKRN